MKRVALINLDTAQSRSGLYPSLITYYPCIYISILASHVMNKTRAYNLNKEPADKPWDDNVLGLPMASEKKPIILVDGSSYLYRAFHALPALTNSKGFPTGAVYGIVNMLKRLMNDYHPTHMAVIFDAKGKTFRDEMYAAYKATRKAMPSELVMQIEPIHNIIKALGIPLITIEGVEADDVIGTLANHAAKQGLKALISTGDKDMAQLVNEHVTLINTMTNTLLNPQGVKEKFGVTPEGMIDYLTLVGDSSDNIPGVPKVGPKTAVKWLDEYGSLNNLITHAAKISGKVGDNFREFLPQIPLTKSLVTIKLDVSLSLEFNDLQLKSADKTALINFYKEMEFKTWLAELLEEHKELQAPTYKNYLLITDEKTLDEFIAKLAKAPIIAFDTETTHIDYMQAKAVGISLSTGMDCAAYIPFAHDYENAPQQLSQTVVLEKLKPILTNPNIKKVAQNIKYDIEILANLGVQIQGGEYDTMLESYVIDSIGSNHNLDSLALKYLGWRTITYDEVAGKGAKQIPFNQVTLEKAGPYAAEDAAITLQLHHTLWPKIKDESGLKSVFETIEMPLVPVLARMERGGVLVDPEHLKKSGDEFGKRVTNLQCEAFTLANKEFNINSPKQLQEILFEVLKLPVLQKTPTGQPSTADNVLQELALEFALPKIIIECRSLSKLISTYTTRLVEQINPNTKRLHTSYNQAGTATGRLSSSDPNLQNIPIRSPEGRRIREAFIAPKGYKLISADYSQIELRLMAHLSQDKNLLTAFNSDIDIHQATAAEVCGVSLDEVTPNMRRDAKVINFGLLYGMSSFGLSKQLGIPKQEAQNYIDRYFARYPDVKNYMNNALEQARKNGFVTTLWGRRLYIPDINASQIPRQRAAERIAINAPLQGSCADIIKLAMIDIDRWLLESNVPAKMIMQVHDELVFEVQEDHIEKVSQEIKQRMVQVAKLSVPLLVSIGVGDNWDVASGH